MTKLHALCLGGAAALALGPGMATGVIEAGMNPFVAKPIAFAGERK
jgi:hypothetical protein